MRTVVLRALIFVACRAALARAQSQGAQDYIIADIFDRIGVTNGYYVEIGFNSRYLLDITEQIAGSEARFLMADAGSPTLVRDGADESALYVLMPMRV